MGRDAEKVDVEVLVEDELEEEVVVLVEEMRPEEVAGGPPALVSLSVKVLFIPSAGTFDPHIFMEHLRLGSLPEALEQQGVHVPQGGLVQGSQTPHGFNRIS